jgi:hypothetical protein
MRPLVAADEPLIIENTTYTGMGIALVRNACSRARESAENRNISQELPLLVEFNRAFVAWMCSGSNRLFSADRRDVETTRMDSMERSTGEVEVKRNRRLRASVDGLQAFVFAPGK